MQGPGRLCLLPPRDGTPRALLAALIRQLLITAAIRSRTTGRLAAMQAACRQRRQDAITAGILDRVAGYAPSCGADPAKGA